MTDEHLEELAALHALELLDEAGRNELQAATQHDPRVRDLLRDFDETAVQLTYDVPTIAPPAALKKAILRQLPARTAASRMLAFTPWMAYAIAACLMILGIVQALEIAVLKTRMQALHSSLVAESGEVARLRQSNELIGLRMEMLEAKDPAYNSAKVMVAWDPAKDEGMVAMEDLPPPPADHDYELWVLDPKASGPMSAGLIKASRCFGVQPVSTAKPGFAVSLEPSGGRSTPTGPILFAVAPGQ